VPKIIKLPKQPKLERKLRVAAYARVSSGKDAMLHSLSAQVSYYSKLIQNNPAWLYCGVYSDEALSGTKDTRENFLRMIEDCRSGKLDMVITKSISRFARNTVTLLETVRELKSLGIDVFFEEQNIHSMSGDGELMLSILASYAQEESRSASENQKWRIRSAFSQGELVNLRFLFGYRVHKGDLEIDPESAEIVRWVFQSVIAGESLSGIARELNQRGIRRAFDGEWNSDRIREMVTNEKYKGDSLLQKKYRNNYLEKKLMRNKGTLTRYYVTDTHPAIIDEATFDAAQEVMRGIRSSAKNPTEFSPFTGKIQCCYCGKNYKKVTTPAGLRWNCSTYQKKGKKFCPSKAIPDDTLRQATASVLGLPAFQENAFRDEISHIEVPDHNLLRFCFHDGHTEDRVWTDRSRRESWTEEMKATQRERRYQCLAK